MYTTQYDFAHVTEATLRKKENELHSQIYLKSYKQLQQIHVSLNYRRTC